MRDAYREIAYNDAEESPLRETFFRRFRARFERLQQSLQGRGGEFLEKFLGQGYYGVSEWIMKSIAASKEFAKPVLPATFELPSWREKGVAHEDVSTQPVVFKSKAGACFSGDSEVLLRNRELKSIKRLRPGDELPFNAKVKSVLEIKKKTNCSVGFGFDVSVDENALPWITSDHSFQVLRPWAKCFRHVPGTEVRVGDRFRTLKARSR